MQVKELVIFSVFLFLTIVCIFYIGAFGYYKSNLTILPFSAFLVLMVFTNSCAIRLYSKNPKDATLFVVVFWVTTLVFALFTWYVFTPMTL